MRGNNPASEIYVRNKLKSAGEAGFRADLCRLQATASLAQLLERALDGFGTRGALERAVIAENAVRVVSWRTVPARKSP